MNSSFENDSDSDYEEIISIIICRRQKTIQERPHYFMIYDDVDFRERFRMTKEGAWNVLQLIRPRIAHSTTWYSNK